jgi:valyl-tRNA synthetase
VYLPTALVGTTDPGLVWTGWEFPRGGDAGGGFDKFDRPNFTAAELHQDEDVLDTWFSSWLWPIEVFKGVSDPGNPDIRYYYPTSVLVTGQDIIFFWVARMIMAGTYYFPDSLPMEKRIPFRDVYFTGMVRDKQGRKMSKSLGNSPDLLDLIDKYGADAVRFGILISSPAGNDLLFDESSLEQGRNFNNKLWNVLKLVKMWESRVTIHPHSAEIHFAVKWFDFKLFQTRATIEKLFLEFKLSEALKTLYSLIWDDFCSWYLEWIKPGFEQSMDKSVFEKTTYFFEQLIQLLHPFMPFITEELYHLLKDRKDDLCVRQFEELVNVEQNDSITAVEISKQLIQIVREFRTKTGKKRDEKITVYAEDIELFPPETFNPMLSLVNAQLSNTRIDDPQNLVKPTLDMEVVLIGTNKFYLDLGTVDKAFKGAVKDKMNNELNRLRAFLDTLNKKLENERFIVNAKPEVIESERKKRDDTELKIKALEESLSIG